MPCDPYILIVLACVALFSLLSKAISRTWVTLPMVLVGVGLLLSQPLKSAADPDMIHSGKILLGEVTLILVLFSDASHVRFRRLAMNWMPPARMLVIGLPLIIATGTAVAYVLMPEAGLAMALLTAALLTPTDAALGQTVVSSPDVPERLSQTINVESGLNDGLVLPFILVGAIFASAGAGLAQISGSTTVSFLRLLRPFIVQSLNVRRPRGNGHAIYRIKRGDRQKVMRLATPEFIRRFLMHVLPDGFHRIRHYGLLASGTRKANLTKIRALLCVQPPDKEDAQDTGSEPAQLTLREPCLGCGGPMRIIEVFRRGQRPTSRAPPREQAA